METVLNGEKGDANSCMIKIVGTQLVDGEEDVVEVTTEANVCTNGQDYYIVYNESQSTGFEGCKTFIKYEPADGRVTLSRIGKTASQLVVAQGERHQCNYETGYGSLTIGVFGHDIKSTLKENKGKISFFYDLDVDASVISSNGVSIEILENI